MKTTVKIFALATLFLGLATSSFAQSTATASASATLLVPISIVKSSDMNFGTVAGSATDGTIVMPYTGVISKTGGAYIISGTTSTATFTVTGDKSNAFTISLPNTTISLTGSPSGSLTVDNIVCEQGASTTLSSGTKLLRLSSVLHIPAGTVAGEYSNSTDLKVTVNYN